MVYQKSCSRADRRLAGCQQIRRLVAREASSHFPVASSPIAGSCGQASAMRTGGCGKVLAQPLCARLANVERGTDGTYRGNSLSCQVSREHHCGLLPKRINHGRTIMRARSGRGVGAARTIIIRSSYDPTSATAGHAATTPPMMPWPRPWATFAASVATMPSPSSHPHTPPRRVQHHHRTRIDEPVHRHENEVPGPAGLAVHPCRDSQSRVGVAHRVSDAEGP